MRATQELTVVPLQFENLPTERFSDNFVMRLRVITTYLSCFRNPTVDDVVQLMVEVLRYKLRD